jgi:hypothetical protein
MVFENLRWHQKQKKKGNACKSNAQKPQWDSIGDDEIVNRSIFEGDKQQICVKKRKSNRDEDTEIRGEKFHGHVHF